jgi:hypothetical protein
MGGGGRRGKGPARRSDRSLPHPDCVCGAQTKLLHERSLVGVFIVAALSARASAEEPLGHRGTPHRTPRSYLRGRRGCQSITGRPHRSSARFAEDDRRSLRGPGGGRAAGRPADLRGAAGSAGGLRQSPAVGGSAAANVASHGHTCASPSEGRRRPLVRRYRTDRPRRHAHHVREPVVRFTTTELCPGSTGGTAASPAQYALPGRRTAI